MYAYSYTVNYGKWSANMSSMHPEKYRLFQSLEEAKEFGDKEAHRLMTEGSGNVKNVEIEKFCIECDGRGFNIVKSGKRVIRRKEVTCKECNGNGTELCLLSQGNILMTTQPKLVKVIGSRPTQAPEGWPIFNAPRPLYGDPTWTGDFIHGIFYSTVCPLDPYGSGFTERNAELDAWELVWVSEDEAVEESLDYYREKFPEVYANIDPTDKDHRGMLIDGWRERQRR